ncbi:hypothetical protein EYF80_027846 [Liparis tanakae]|uniref:Uncharacterized protein n=1 Tax=Liparis tanakae TaxID=230148 RepID=A0A4Z2H7X9_9TELE|nr:hypothetical protein EYF80_027846 [Liparis tanakae]
MRSISLVPIAPSVELETQTVALENPASPAKSLQANHPGSTRRASPVFFTKCETLSRASSDSFRGTALNPSTPLLHPANTNTPSSHWKTSVFLGQGRGPTFNLPQLSHMKQLDCGQGKQAGRSWGIFLYAAPNKRNVTAPTHSPGDLGVPGPSVALGLEINRSIRSSGA